jgi:hypothetical protein
MSGAYSTFTAALSVAIDGTGTITTLDIGRVLNDEPPTASNMKSPNAGEPVLALAPAPAIPGFEVLEVLEAL